MCVQPISCRDEGTERISGGMVSMTTRTVGGVGMKSDRGLTRMNSSLVNSDSLELGQVHREISSALLQRR